MNFFFFFFFNEVKLKTFHSWLVQIKILNFHFWDKYGLIVHKIKNKNKRRRRRKNIAKDSKL